MSKIELEHRREIQVLENGGGERRIPFRRNYRRTPNHINEEFMKQTPFKTRVAHGVLVIGFASTTAGMAVAKARQVCMSYGYDKIRFLKPMFIGDTVTVVYTWQRMMRGG